MEATSKVQQSPEKEGRQLPQFQRVSPWVEGFGKELFLKQASSLIQGEALLCGAMALPTLSHSTSCTITSAEVHQTLRVTPAMETGIADHVWSIEELVSLLDRCDRMAA